MTGINDRFWWKGEDFFTNSIEENFSTASGQVPATDAIGEQHIPAKKLAALRKVEAKAAGAVTWDME